MRRKAPVPFGKGPTEKDPNHGHLACGLLHSTSAGGCNSLRRLTCLQRHVVSLNAHR
jgi:hypothetical protein